MNKAEKSNPKAETHALVRYDEMCRAIAEAYRVDEVKDIRDKAMAFALYARQANNHDAELKAIQIRLRAERRAGELSKELPRGAGNQYAEKQKLLADAGTERTLTADDFANALLEGAIKAMGRK